MKTRSSHPANTRKPLVAAIALSLLCAGAPALAQEEDEATVLDTVLVTASKRSEDVRDVPAAISVIDEQQIENLNANQLSDYADYVPGLQVQNNGAPGLTSVSMRGIAALSSGTTVGTYIDEVPVGSSGLYQAATTLVLDYLPFDLDRIEVLRGPQGTLYGASTMGGLLKYVTREPDLGASAFRFGAGFNAVSDGGNGWDVRFTGSLPLKQDRLGLAFGYARNDLAGYTDNAFDGSEDIDSGEQESARAALFYDGDKVDLRFSVISQSTAIDGRAGEALDADTGGLVFGRRTDQYWVVPGFSKDIDLYSLTFDVDLGSASFVSASSWSKTDTFYAIDATIPFGGVANLLLGLPQPGASSVDYSLDLEKFTQEFRLVSAGDGPLTWMVGAFYTQEDAVQGQFVDLTQLDGSPLPAPFDQIAGVLADLSLPSDYTEMAVFANASWQFTDRFSLGAGVRQSSNDQEFVQDVTAGLLVPLGVSGGTSEEDVFTWSLSPQFQVNDDVMVYGRVATGYQPGGPNVAAVGLPTSVDSSMLTSTELGMKASFADGRGLIDIAAYSIAWEDIQVGTSVNGVGGLVNGGEATSEGIEMALAFRPNDAWRLGLNASWIRAELKSDFEPVVVPQAGFDVELVSGLGGDRMPYVPKMSWSATAEYRFDVGQAWTGRVGGAWRHVGDRVAGTSDRQRVLVGGAVVDEVVTAPLDLRHYGALDLYAGVGNTTWDVRVFLNNATDEKGYSSVATVESALTGAVSWLRAVPIQPRTVGLQFDYRF